MLKSKLKGSVLLLISSLVLVWRVMDYAIEAANEGFHMTRGGFVLRGVDAQIIEIVVILSIIALIWMVLTNLVQLNLTNPSRK